MKTIRIRPATVDDAYSISQVQCQALNRYHEFYAGFWTNHPRDVLPISTESALKDSKNTFLVAVDTATDHVVGFIRYHVVLPEDMEEEGHPAAAGSNQTQPAVSQLYAPKDHMEELWKKFCERDDEMDAVYMSAAKGRKHLYIRHVMIDPKYQRKGIGQKLLATVLEKSDTEKMPTFLVSSAEAHGLYKKLGFSDIGKDFGIDNEAWAREMMKIEQGLGMDEKRRFLEECKGLNEMENYMVREVK